MSEKRIRVGVSGHDLKFWLPLQHALEATGRFEFRHDTWRGHDTHDPAVSEGLIAWADVLVAEWALGNAIYYAAHKRPHQKLIVRLHAQERRTDHPGKIDYAKVDTIVFVGPHIRDECIAKFGMPPEKCLVIGNFVDTSRYFLPKMGGAEYTLGMIGNAPSSKRMDLAVDTLELLLQRDDRYVLRVKGASPATIPWLWGRVAERSYYESLYTRINSGPLRYRVIFDPRGNDVQHWLKMVGTILSPSDAESFHMAVAEGAASGALPVVWSWPGAQDLYPEFELVGSAREAADRIEFYNRSAAGARIRRQAAEIIRQRYDGRVIQAAWEQLLPGAGPAAAVTSVAARHANDRGLLVVWAIDSWARFHRKEMLQALANHLSESHDILVIEPGNHFETVMRLGMAKPEELHRMLGGDLLQEGGNVFRSRLFTGSVPAGLVRASYHGSADHLKVLDGLVSHHFGRHKEVIHWTYKPDQALALRDHDRFIYEVYDEYTMNFGTGEVHQATAEAEPIALRRAEHVFFTSTPLYERKAEASRGASLVSNGVAYDSFARYRLPEFKAAGRPVAGYLGNLSVFFDWALMLDVCRQMPDIDFVLHGQVELPQGDPRWLIHEQLGELPNVRFTGRVNREAGAAAVTRYDVLLIPFVVNDAMHAVNPLKLWEYFAAGRPVVSSPMDAINSAAPLVTIATGADEWTSSIRQCLGEGAVNPELVELRIAKAREHCWSSLTVTHADIVRRITAGASGAVVV